MSVPGCLVSRNLLHSMAAARAPGGWIESPVSSQWWWRPSPHTGFGKHQMGRGLPLPLALWASFLLQWPNALQKHLKRGRIYPAHNFRVQSILTRKSPQWNPERELVTLHPESSKDSKELMYSSAQLASSSYTAYDLLPREWCYHSGRVFQWTSIHVIKIALHRHA